MKKDCIVFEVGFEVVNKVGGIHTVLSSKASIMKNNLKGYFLVGPYIPRQAAVDFEDEPPSKEFRRVFDKLEKFGIKCYSGHWIVPGRPKCLLIDVEEYSKNTDEIKKEYWKNWKIDSLNSPKEFDERIAWSKATGILIDELTKEVFPKEKVIAHFHEWYSGAGLLHLKLANPKIKTVFTTHATRIGRAIANSGKNLYELVENNLKKGTHFPDRESRKYRLEAIHLMEKKSAKEADVFTTVSEITSIEAEYILAKKADVIVPNGLDMEKFPFMEELSTLHLKYRNRIREFVIDYFAPYYYIDVRDTLFFFILGRYEFRNKGVDIFIDALGELNNRLKKSELQRKVIVFIWTPIKTRGKNLEVLKHMAIYDRMEEEIDSEMSDIKERIFRFISMGMTPRGEELLDEEFKHTISKMLVELRSKNRKLPPISAFELEKGNEITKAIKKN
ncbi:hypothetical protein KJ660_02685, partial [Candidatus Micrarchaeota archaeon]|nr:hypothetical protein [Candidatus Micrarchaeota archaeon]